MMQPIDDLSDTRLSRREAIRRAAMLAGVAFSSDWLLASQAAPAKKTYLTSAQADMVSAMAERILPRTDTPGARDVGVPAFIDLLYGEFMTDAERDLLTAGLADLDTRARAAGGAFATLSAERQDAILREVAQAEEGREQGFFRLFRSATVLGYFTSEEVGRNVLHYDPVPGRYDGCVPIDEVGRRNWTT
jgi:hypothetical protein